MNLINQSLQQDVYQYINQPPSGITVSKHEDLNSGKWFDFYKKQNNEDSTWYLEIQIDDEFETVLYYPYTSMDNALNDYTQLTNFLNYIYSK